MKHLVYTLLICLTLGSSSCDFLDIDTPGIVNKDKMFENEQGFIDAMNGVYASMATAELYGEQLSFGFVDEIAQLYYNDYEMGETTQTRTYDLKYLDEDIRPKIDAIWNSGYNVISSVNSILDNIPLHDFAALPRIKGEALAVRAFIHFDLLRLFAPNIERANETAIPYVEHFSIEPVKRSSVKEVYDYILRDAKEAYSLLTEAAPIEGHEKKELYVSKYAAAAIVARVANWGKDHAKAKFYAEEALKGGFRLVREEQVKMLFLGYTARTECIWGLHAPMMYLSVRKCLRPQRLTGRMNMVRDKHKEIFHVSSFTATNNDYRYQAYFTRTQWTHSVTLLSKLYDKYYDEEQQSSEGRTPAVNMLRSPEMYYILAESVYDESPQEALNYLNEVVTARGLLPLKAQQIDSRKKFEDVLINEITKEYWGEGHLFMTNKRFNRDMEGVNGLYHAANDKTYILPLPESEKSEGIN